MQTLRIAEALSQDRQWQEIVENETNMVNGKKEVHDMGPHRVFLFGYSIALDGSDCDSSECEPPAASINGLIFCY